MKLAFGADHAGYPLRVELEKWALEQGHDCTSHGAMNDQPYDYPDAADAVACEVLQNSEVIGVLMCGTGIGVSIRANRYPHIRAANCTSVEMAKLARLHNHANVLCLGGRITPLVEAIAILAAFLTTEPDLAERHVRRTRKLADALASC